MVQRTYRDLFNTALEEQISDGGYVGDVVTLVNAYQNHDNARPMVFDGWIQREDFTCSACGKFFKVTDNNEVEEDHYVLCKKCRRLN